jgi:peptidoglycan hydrolase FlgJ
VAELSIGPSMAASAVKAPAHVPDDPAKIHDAAQQFESLLIGQILRSERESGNGWLGSGGDPASDCATDYAEQQFATLLARQGGLGLASLIAAGLQSAQAVATGSNSPAHSSLPASETKAGTRS